MRIPQARIIVIEGPDGARKTTLAGKLRAEFGFQGYQHVGPPPPEDSALRYYLRKVLSAVNTPENGGTVFDRFALSEMVYGLALRGTKRLQRTEWLLIRDALDDAGAVRILCLPRLLDCERVWAERPEEELIRDRNVFRQVYVDWARLQDDTGQLIYDWSDESYDRIIAAIERGV